MVKRRIEPLGVDCNVRTSSRGFTIRYTREYEPPPLNLSTLNAIALHYGTNDVDVDGYSSAGCETCDWGSEYGHDIEVIDPTKNIDDSGLPL